MISEKGKINIEQGKENRSKNIITIKNAKSKWNEVLPLKIRVREQIFNPIFRVREFRFFFKKNTSNLRQKGT